MNVILCIHNEEIIKKCDMIKKTRHENLSGKEKKKAVTDPVPRGDNEYKLSEGLISHRGGQPN
jgi:hypothetical protein